MVPGLAMGKLIILNAYNNRATLFMVCFPHTKGHKKAHTCLYMHAGTPKKPCTQKQTIQKVINKPVPPLSRYRYLTFHKVAEHPSLGNQ